MGVIEPLAFFGFFSRFKGLIYLQSFSVKLDELKYETKCLNFTKFEYEMIFTSEELVTQEMSSLSAGIFAYSRRQYIFVVEETSDTNLSIYNVKINGSLVFVDSIFKTFELSLVMSDRKGFSFAKYQNDRIYFILNL